MTGCLSFCLCPSYHNLGIVSHNFQFLSHNSHDSRTLPITSLALDFAWFLFGTMLHKEHILPNTAYSIWLKVDSLPSNCRVGGRKIVNQNRLADNFTFYFWNTYCSLCLKAYITADFFCNFWHYLEPLMFCTALLYSWHVWGLFGQQCNKVSTSCTVGTGSSTCCFNLLLQKLGKRIISANKRWSNKKPQYKHDNRIFVRMYLYKSLFTLDFIFFDETFYF